ncbi:MAG TPA: glycerophosphodiester phosphodiesterase [Streptosporangiaceae bacterium]
MSDGGRPSEERVLGKATGSNSRPNPGRNHEKTPAASAPLAPAPTPRAPAISAPAISAHRGGEETTCPGTFEAYQRAVAAGAEYVEFDVRRTSDGQLVAYHHARTPSARAISAVSYRRLCRLSGYDVPLVTDVMRLLAGRATGHIDLKEARDAASVLGHAQKILGTAGFVATTRDDALAAELRRRFPGARLALTIGGDLAGTARLALRQARTHGLSRLDRVLACQVSWAAVHHRLAAAGMLRECRLRGIKTIVWTVNDDLALVRWLSHPEVDVLVTDRPARAAALRARLAPALGRVQAVSAR